MLNHEYLAGCFDFRDNNSKKLTDLLELLRRTIEWRKEHRNLALCIGLNWQTGNI